MGFQLPRWMAGEFTVLRTDDSTAVVRNDFVDAFERGRLIDCARAPLLALPGPGAGARDGELGGGRGTVRIVAAGSLGEAVVRPYRRGGWVEPVNRRRYFFGQRAFDELVATHRLRRRGAPVPEALAAVQSAARPGYVACLATRRLPRRQRAAVALADGAVLRRRAALAAAGRAVRRLHHAGGIHADLNAHNILVPEDADGPAFIIDLDRARVREGPVSGRPARANLRRLRRSLGKLGLSDALADWEVLEEAYEAPPGPPPAA